MSLRRRLVGDLPVSAVGLGGARWSLAERPDDGAIARTIHAALDAGITLFDTARAYTPAGVRAHSERVLADALRQHPAGGDAVVLTKGGHERRPDGTFAVDGCPATLRRHCHDALVSLGRSRLDGFLLHWPDPEVPVGESVAALAELREEGLTRLVGVCNVDVDQLRAAHDAARVDLVQNPYSALTGGDDAVLAFCREHGISHVAYSPLGGTTGTRMLTRRGAGLATVAHRYDASAHELALAWLLASRPGLVPVVGASRPATARAAARACSLALDEDALRELDAAFDPAPIGQLRG